MVRLLRHDLGVEIQAEIGHVAGTPRDDVEGGPQVALIEIAQRHVGLGMMLEAAQCPLSRSTHTCMVANVGAFWSHHHA